MRTFRRRRAFCAPPSSSLHGTLDVILTMLVTFFLLLDGGKFGEAALRFLDPADRVQMRQVATNYRRRRLVAGASWSAARCRRCVDRRAHLHMPNPAALGLMVGLLEVITFIGPILAGAIVGIVPSTRPDVGDRRNPVPVRPPPVRKPRADAGDPGPRRQPSPARCSVRGSGRIDGIRDRRHVPRPAGRGRNQRRTHEFFQEPRPRATKPRSMNDLA